MLRSIIIHCGLIVLIGTSVSMKERRNASGAAGRMATAGASPIPSRNAVRTPSLLPG